MESQHLDWDLGVYSEPPGGGKSIAFNQLLDNLRVVYEEVCARNIALERQVSHNGNNHSQKSPALFESISDPWLPSNYVAPKEGPPPRRPLRVTSTPRSYMVQATDTVARNQEYLTQSIDTLVEHQKFLAEQIGLILAAKNAAPKVPKPAGSRFGNTHRREPSVKRQNTDNVKTRLASIRLAANTRAVSTRAASTRAPSARKASIDPTASIGPGSATLRESKHLHAHIMLSDSEKSDGARASSASDVDDVDHDQGKAKKTSNFTRATMRFAVQTKSTKDYDDDDSRWSTNETEPNGPIYSMRKGLRRVLQSTVFSIVSSSVILSYACVIALETNLMSQNPDMEPTTIKSMHYAYTGVFFLELLLRFIAEGCHCFYGDDAIWNRLDAFFILSGVAEIVMESAMGAAHSDSGGSVLRGVRIFRVFRTVRLFRTFKRFYEFQKMAYALMSCLKTLICSLALLLFVMYFFAVWFTQSAADTQMRNEIVDLDLRYGSIMSTSYTLFLSVSNGISWDGCYMPLYYLSFWTAQGFILYIIVVLFGVLNVVTSVFVESVIRSVQHYKDLIVQDKEEEKKIAVAHVSEVFRQIDVDGSGQVSIDEMEHFLQDPALRKYMAALDIDAEDTRLLFRLLDTDASGVISLEEFCDGCLRLKGEAKSIDIHILIFQVQNFLGKWGEFTDYVEESFSMIRKKLTQASSRANAMSVAHIVAPQ